MSKLSFRARALDALKPLPVFRCEDLPDLHEYVSINRAVPQMPTGMEKDEESVRILPCNCRVYAILSCFFCQSAQLWMQQNGRLCVKRFTRYFVAVLLCAPSLTSGIFSWIYLMSVLGVKVGFCRSVPTRIVQQNTKGVRWPRRHRHFVGFCPAVAANGSQRAVMRNLEISVNIWGE